MSYRIYRFVLSLVKLLDTYLGVVNEEAFPAYPFTHRREPGWLSTQGTSHPYQDSPSRTHSHNSEQTHTNSCPDCSYSIDIPARTRLHGGLKKTNTWSHGRINLSTHQRGRPCQRPSQCQGIHYRIFRLSMTLLRTACSRDGATPKNISR